MGIPLESTQAASSKQTSEPVLPSTKKQRGEKAKKGGNSSRGQHRSSGRLGTDAIGFFLSSIGRVPLLTAAEEIELAHHVQTMKK